MSAILDVRNIRTPRTDSALAAVSDMRKLGEPEYRHYDPLVTSHTELELDFNRVVEALRLLLPLAVGANNGQVQLARQVLRDIGAAA